MIGTSLYIVAYAILFSLFEIEIEGGHGWAKNLPTPTILFTFTTYHILMNIIVILTLMYSLYPADILTMVFYITAWFLIEDTMWFILNPHYTIENYKRDKISWLKDQEWYMGMPLQNYIGATVMASITYYKNSEELLLSGIIMIIGTTIIVFLAPFYHRFYINTHTLPSS